MPIVMYDINTNKLFEIDDSVRIIGPGGVQHPWNIVSNWSAEQLAELQIFRVAVASPPEGKQIKPGTVPWYEWEKQGKSVVQKIEVEDIPIVKLDDIKKTALEELDTKILQINPTILFIHDQKRKEAEFFLADERKPDMTKYPFIEAALKTKVDGKNAKEIANLWLKKATEFKLLLAAIEAKRIECRQKIVSAENSKIINDVLNQFSEMINKHR